MKDNWPKGSYYHDSRAFIPDDELEAICEKAWLMSSVEKISGQLVDGQWGSIKTLYWARSAVREADTFCKPYQTASLWLAIANGMNISNPFES